MTFHKIGETFDFRLDKDTVIRIKVEGDGKHRGCTNCYFDYCIALPSEIQDRIPPCTSELRPDHKDVHFIEVKQ